MFGRNRQADSLNGGTAHARPWFRSERPRQRDRRYIDTELISELRWLWRNACASTALSPMIYTPSGASLAVPVIADVDLGPPIVLTVKVRPGQTAADFVAAAPTIAAAMDVAELEVTPLGGHWVRIELVPAPAVCVPSGEAWRQGA